MKNITKFDWTINDFPSTKWDLNPSDIKYDPTGWVYNWFSNFEPSELIIEDKNYKSVENWYQANKASNEKDFEAIRVASIPQSKKLGRTIQVRQDWELIKFDIMFIGLLAKCEQHPNFVQRLKETTGEIVEWNNWNDIIWGASIKTSTGRNALGIQLMYIRDCLNEVDC